MQACALAQDRRLEQLFIDQARATPEAPAIFFRGAALSYGELSIRVEKLACALLRHGVRPGVLVAVDLQRTPTLIAVLLAILKAGGAYLPLDGRYPAERTRFVLADSRAALLLTDGDSSLGGGFAGNVLELSAGALIQREYRAPPAASGPAELAYVIYTSGSTGAPKGVMLGHGATRLVEWARGAYATEDLSRVAATTSLCFDPSIFEIFVPLCTGGALVLKETVLEPFRADERPTLLDSAPSVVTELNRADAIPRSLMVLNIGGEALSGELVRDIHRARPNLRVYNHYGPTEATTCATVAELRPDLVSDPPIGRPVRGASVVLLDPAGQAVAEGETGEIHIGGPGLALGYLNQPALTAARFREGASGRTYRTGDLGCWRDDGLHFAGRLDTQVKIRGFRVELGEVESALRKIAQVENAVVITRDVAGRSQIVAYVQSQQPLLPEDVRQALAGWLPDYMLPAHVVVLDALPLLASGKIDRASLPAPTEEPHPAGRASRLEQAVIHVFQEVLARRFVGPDDSFFDLGGDSLSSVQAALRLDEVLGYELPAALLHQLSTPRSLARSLEHGRTRDEGHLSLLQPGGPAPPLFCMADLFGHAFNYLSLARRLGDARPIYGVVPGSLQANFAREGDIARLTRSFVAELRTVQPAGPYLIAGFSAGGTLAMDVACLLESQGEAVRLILLDSYLHSRRPSARAVIGWAVQQGRTLIRARRRLAARSWGLLVKLARRMAPGAPPAWIPRSQLAFAASMMKAGAAYKPPTFSGPTLIIKASNRDSVDRLFDCDGLLGWSGALKGDVVAASAPGGHHQFLREPLVAATALAVSQFLLTYA